MTDDKKVENVQDEVQTELTSTPEVQETKPEAEAPAPVEEENPFDQAAEEISKEVPTETEAPAPTKSPAKADEVEGEEEINVDTLNETEWIKTPKEIGESTPVIKISKFSKKPGKMIAPKGMDPFWSGLTRKDKATGQIENAEEYNLKGIADGKEIAYKVDSWEQVGKIMTLLRYCKRTNVMFTGQTVQFERTAKGTASAGHNFVLHVPSLGMKVEGDDNKMVEVKSEA